MIFFDLAILDLLLLFDVLRKNTIITFLAIINQSLMFTQNKTTQFYNTSMYELSFNCSRISMEYYLNDLFDPTLRRIFIRDIENTTAVVVYNQNEGNEPVYVYNASENEEHPIIYNYEELLDLIDFEVVLPATFFFNEDLLKSTVNKFKLPGMKYTIVQE